MSVCKQVGHTTSHSDLTHFMRFSIGWNENFTVFLEPLDDYFSGFASHSVYLVTD